MIPSAPPLPVPFPAIPASMLSLGMPFGRSRKNPESRSGTRSDRRIAERLARSLEGSGFVRDADLRFLVYHGTVILQGHLEDGIARAALVASISASEGVRRVIDRLTPEFGQLDAAPRRAA